MNAAECLSEVKKLEAKMMRMPPRTEQDQEFWDARRAAIFESVQGFNINTLREAFDAIIEQAQGEEKTYFPTVPEILEACREVEDASRPKVKAPRAKHDPVEHNCNPEKPPNTPALTELQWAFPYEAAHILCRGDIPATCPLCGKQRIERGIFDDITKRHPQDTANWNGCYKGLMVCEKCSRKAGR